MPGQHYKHWWFYFNIKPGVSFQHVGKEWYGLIFNRWPILAAFRDRTWYEPATSAGIVLCGFVEVGVFIEWKPRGIFAHHADRGTCPTCESKLPI